MICPNCGSDWICEDVNGTEHRCLNCYEVFDDTSAERANLIANALKRIYEIEKRLKEIDK